MNKTIPTLAVVLGLSFCGTARADYSPEYELGVFGGAHLWNANTGVGRPDSMESSQIGHGGLFGVRLGIGFHPRFSLETELGLAPSFTKGFDLPPDPMTGESKHRSAQVLGIGYRLQGVLHVLTGRVRPFLLAGIGGFTTSSSDFVLYAQDTTYSVGLGGGLKADFGKNWGMRLDGRALLHRGVAGGPSIAPDGEVSLGIFGRIGSVQPPPPALADRDKDGITDQVDLCPDVAGIPAQRGCPAPEGALPTPPAVPPAPADAPAAPPLPAPPAAAAPAPAASPAPAAAPAPAASPAVK